MNVIEVKNAFKQFKSNSESVSVMCGFNMNLQQGKIYSLMGSSGCGKTTLISCIVGNLSLDRGEIKLFNDSPVPFPSSRVGLMPQEMALIEIFKVKEIIWFFGRIYGLTCKEIAEKLNFLTELLELPDGEQMIKLCSGGQKRRISFALTLIHDPDLVILDEPTVGVDALLREKIWNHLTDLKTTKNTTILLSTHYIEEAKQSDLIGLMRNGVLIIEDTPQNILRVNEARNLDEAFLKLSEKQDECVEQIQKLNEFEMLNIKEMPTTEILDLKLEKSENKPRSPKIMGALLKKHYLQFLRNPLFFCTQLYVPTIFCIGLYFGLSNINACLVLGVVNHEVQNISDCFNSSLKTFELKGSECVLQKSSCRFINAFDQNAAKLKFYNSYDEAYKDARLTLITGLIVFPKSYTKSLLLFNDDDSQDESNQEGNIQISLDQTDATKTMLLTNEIYKTYERFMTQMMADCGKLEAAGRNPINIQAVYDELNFNFRKTMTNGAMVTIIFLMLSSLMSTSILDEKSSGIWDRLIVAGVRPNQFLVSHLIEGFLVNIILVTGLTTFVFALTANAKTINSFSLIFLILFLSGIFGLTLGILISIILKSVSVSMYINTSLNNLGAFVGGMFWPIEALHAILKFFGRYINPVSMPAIAVRAVASKDSTLAYRDVQIAFLFLIVWICCTLGLAALLNKRK